jgi:ankyrin repeat protein
MNTFKKPFNPNIRKTFSTIIAPEVHQPTEKIAQLFSLIEQGNISEVKKFVLSSRIKLSYKMDDETVLHKVLGIDDLKMPEPKKLEFIEYLISNGAYVNSYDKYNVTPLHLAVQKRYLSIVKLLVSKGANINAQTSESLTPLHYATLMNIQPCPPENMPKELIPKPQDKTIDYKKFGWLTELTEELAKSDVYKFTRKTTGVKIRELMYDFYIKECFRKNL